MVFCVTTDLYLYQRADTQFSLASLFPQCQLSFLMKDRVTIFDRERQTDSSRLSLRYNICDKREVQKNRFDSSKRWRGVQICFSHLNKDTYVFTTINKHKVAPLIYKNCRTVDNLQILRLFIADVSTPTTAFWC